MIKFKTIITNITIIALEKSLGIRSDSWKRFVKTGALPLAEKKPDF